MPVGTLGDNSVCRDTEAHCSVCRDTGTHCSVCRDTGGHCSACRDTLVSVGTLGHIVVSVAVGWGAGWVGGITEQNAGTECERMNEQMDGKKKRVQGTITAVVKQRERERERWYQKKERAATE